MCSWWFIWNVKIKLPLYHKGMLKHTEACQGTGNTEICLLVPCEPCKIGGMNLNSRLREIMLSNRKTQATSWSWYPPKPANYFCLIIWGTLVEKSKGFGKKEKTGWFSVPPSQKNNLHMHFVEIPWNRAEFNDFWK